MSRFFSLPLLLSLTLSAQAELTPEQAQQSGLRTQANHWFEHTFASRLDDKERGAIVLVMQRLHMHDLSGYLLNKNVWEHLCLPAIAPEQKTYSFGGIAYKREGGEVHISAALENR